VDWNRQVDGKNQQQSKTKKINKVRKKAVGEADMGRKKIGLRVRISLVYHLNEVV